MIMINSDLKSLNTGIPVNVTFINNGYQEVNIRWVDFEGMEKIYPNIAPGAELIQSTFHEHSWRVYDPIGGCVREYVADVFKKFNEVRVLDDLLAVGETEEDKPVGETKEDKPVGETTTKDLGWVFLHGLKMGVNSKINIDSNSELNITGDLTVENTGVINITDNGKLCISESCSMNVSNGEFNIENARVEVLANKKVIIDDSKLEVKRSELILKGELNVKDKGFIYMLDEGKLNLSPNSSVNVSNGGIGIENNGKLDISDNCSINITQGGIHVANSTLVGSSGKITINNGVVSLSGCKLRVPNDGMIKIFSATVMEQNKI